MIDINPTIERISNNLIPKTNASQQDILSYVNVYGGNAADGLEQAYKLSDKFDPELIKKAIEVGINQYDLEPWASFESQKKLVPQHLDLFFHCQRQVHLDTILDTVNSKGLDYLRLFSKEESNLLGIATEAMSQTGKSEPGEHGEDSLSIFLNQPIKSYGEIIWIIPPRNIIKQNIDIRIFDKSTHGGLSGKMGELSFRTPISRNSSISSLSYPEQLQTLLDNGMSITELGVDISSFDAVCMLPANLFPKIVEKINSLDKLSDIEKQFLKSKFIKYNPGKEAEVQSQIISNLQNYLDIDTNLLWQSQGLMESEVLKWQVGGWSKVNKVPVIQNKFGSDSKRLVLLESVLKTLGFEDSLKAIPKGMEFFIIRDIEYLLKQAQQDKLDNTTKSELVKSIFNLCTKSNIQELNDMEKTAIKYIGAAEKDFINQKPGLNYWIDLYTPLLNFNI